MHQLTHRDTPFVCSPDCHRAFEEHKVRLTMLFVLVYPNFGREFVLETDASIQGLSVVSSKPQSQSCNHGGNSSAGTDHGTAEYPADWDSLQPNSPPVHSGARCQESGAQSSADNPDEGELQPATKKKQCITGKSPRMEPKPRRLRLGCHLRPTTRHPGDGRG